MRTGAAQGLPATKPAGAPPGGELYPHRWQRSCTGGGRGASRSLAQPREWASAFIVLEAVSCYDKTPNALRLPRQPREGPGCVCVRACVHAYAKGGAGHPGRGLGQARPLQPGRRHWPGVHTVGRNGRAEVSEAAVFGEVRSQSDHKLKQTPYVSEGTERFRFLSETWELITDYI